MFTDRIRSMGEGNVFTGVCLFHGGVSLLRSFLGGGGGGLPPDLLPGGVRLWPDTHPWPDIPSDRTPTHPKTKHPLRPDTPRHPHTEMATTTVASYWNAFLFHRRLSFCSGEGLGISGRSLPGRWLSLVPYPLRRVGMPSPGSLLGVGMSRSLVPPPPPECWLLNLSWRYAYYWNAVLYSLKCLQ